MLAKAILTLFLLFITSFVVYEIFELLNPLKIDWKVPSSLVKAIVILGNVSDTMVMTAIKFHPCSILHESSW